MHAYIHRIQCWIENLFLIGVFVLVVQGDGPPPDAYNTKLDRIVGADRFSIMRWEVEAFFEKGFNGLLPAQDYLDDEQRAQFAVDYLDLTRHHIDLQQQVEDIYADPGIDDADAASLDLRAERDQVRDEIERRRPLAEGIVQEQVASVFSDNGLGLAGQLFPPVQSRITPLPYILIISPRERIAYDLGIDLLPGLTVDRANEIEDGVFDQLDQAALVVPIGGLATYPSMILETQDLLFLLQTVSHEWVHHWLYLRPLGYRYLDGGETRTINETVASLIGDEVGILTLKRYYPDIAKDKYSFVYDPPKPLEEQLSTSPPPEPDPNVFNFNREMFNTRVQVDEYLEQAQELFTQADEAEQANRAEEALSLREDAWNVVETAEQYMEDRRAVFVKNGYQVRKLNQAYFAFYGSYADAPGASGADPIGPAVRELRAHIPEIDEFLNVASSVVSLDDLNRVLEPYR